jgi:hypothetical protein
MVSFCKSRDGGQKHSQKLPSSPTKIALARNGHMTTPHCKEGWEIGLANHGHLLGLVILPSQFKKKKKSPFCYQRRRQLRLLKVLIMNIYDLL